MVLKRERFNLEQIATKNTINSEMSIIKILWNLFMSEKRYNLPTSFKEYYKSIAKITLGEVESLLHRRATIPKREIVFEDINIEAKIKILEEEVVREGERIWLI